MTKEKTHSAGVVEEPPMSNLVQRILTGLVGMPIVVGLAYLGGWWYAGLAAVLMAGAQYEFYAMAPEKLSARHVGMGLLMGAMFVLYQMGIVIGPVLVVLCCLILVVDVFDASLENGWQQFTWMITGAVYPAGLFSFAIPLRTEWGGLLTSQEAFGLTVGLIVLVWVTDSMAYFVGKSIGKTSLAPRISPKKTWEGTLGGFAGALAFAVLLKVFVLPVLGWQDVVACTVIGGVGGQVGDLIESRLKRVCGVKDSSNLLPGHGGVLDRIDGLVLAFPLYYLYLSRFAGFLG